MPHWVVETFTHTVMKIKAGPERGSVVGEFKSPDEALPPQLPFQLGRILVPVDFSDTAKKALQYAVPFGTAFDAEVVLLHVMQPYSIPVEFGYLPPDWAETQQQFLDSAQDELAKLCAGEIGNRARTQVQVREGVPWQEIVAAAQETRTDLIILATHGRTGLSHVLLGSVAERVVRHAPCPVLVVRDAERDFLPPSANTDPPPADPKTT